MHFDHIHAQISIIEAKAIAIPIHIMLRRGSAGLLPPLGDGVVPGILVVGTVPGALALLPLALVLVVLRGFPSNPLMT